MPRPTSAGVLGMQRTTRSLASQRAMLSERMPAATLRCSAPALCAAHRLRGFAEGLRLDGPDHQLGAAQRRAGGSVGLHAQLARQALARLGPGLHHLQPGRRQSLLEQAADDRGGHVAAPDEGDARVLECHGAKSKVSHGRAGRQSWPMNRQELLARLASPTVWDLAIVGGGATGLGVALDAAARGFSVLLLESHDFASGTSSRATKLVHGGVRYLAQGNIPLVREALHERSVLLHNAPHLAQPLPFVMPSYRLWETPFYGVGLKLYDALAGKAGLAPTRFLGRAGTLQALPTARAEGLKGGVEYWDGQFDDARLALALARTAAAQGALLLNYCAGHAASCTRAAVRAACAARIGRPGAPTKCAPAAWSTPPASGWTSCASRMPRPLGRPVRADRGAQPGRARGGRPRLPARAAMR